jgi:hypothetical protein
LVTDSCPDISNSVSELSKVADSAPEDHFKALLRTIKYVMGTEYQGLFLQPNMNNDGFYLEGISDSDFVGDPDTRISVYAYVSKAGKSVTPSSTGAEYYSTTEISREVIPCKNLFEEVGVQLQFPITTKCDSLGAIYLANDHCNSHIIKHNGTRCELV